MIDKKIEMSLDIIMGDRFAKYSKYIIQDRALPDVRDGLKPVQRRILYSMFKEGNLQSKAYRKSAKTVGNVIGNYHPHGDSSVYDAMVRMSQDWKYRVPLVDMQGNNGSIDNDPAAAMRYTEARLSAISELLLKDIDKETVLFSLNFDDTEYEPTVLPAAYPNLLVNGATGISAGYATDIPPHNLHEVIDATICRITNPDCSLEQLMEHMKGPDFPTGAIVEGKEGIEQAFKYGKGKVILRAVSTIEQTKTMNKICISEIPYEVNKAELVRKIDEIRFNRNIDGIIEVRDESDRDGLMIVIELKKEVSIENTLNYFYKNTDLQKNYNYNMVAIKDKRPNLMGLKDILDGYINHQIDVITKSTLFDLQKANRRKHIVAGLIKAISILDEVVALIRKSKDKGDAKNNLITKFDFSELQAEAIVMLQLYRLTNTDIVSLQNEDHDLDKQIVYLNAILDSDERLREEIINRLTAVKNTYKIPRLSIIKDEIKEIKIDEKAMILSEDINVSITRDGYIKRISNRSIKASEGSLIGKKEDDYLLKLIQMNTVESLLLFTNKGNYLYIPAHKIEEFKWKDIGKHVSYLVSIDSTEKIIEAIVVHDFSAPFYILMVSKFGQIKRTKLEDFEVTRYSKSLKCFGLKEHDEVISASLTNGNCAVLLSTYAGYTGMYSEQEVSIVGTKAAGIKALNVKDDHLIAANTFDPFANLSIMLFSENVGVKRLKLDDIQLCSRQAKGMTVYKNPKSKAIHLKDVIVCPIDTLLQVHTTEDVYRLVPKDYSNASLEQKPTSMTTNKTEVVHLVTTDIIQDTKLVKIETVAPTMKKNEHDSFKEEMERTLFTMLDD
ncbi:DNA topoisomerase IV subunit A [Tannockella kyphosi]|uniref:DNA topoisomerase IV subunit A n=1 Tax=Tannockella kyphosi TaxID=2899121 RepID=UPI0020113AA4|nr:DNA topoisomerase IV subunit A [Tannockella kyphosi]